MLKFARKIQIKLQTQDFVGLATSHLTFTQTGQISCQTHVSIGIYHVFHSPKYQKNRDAENRK